MSSVVHFGFSISMSFSHVRKRQRRTGPGNRINTEHIQNKRQSQVVYVTLVRHLQANHPYNAFDISSQQALVHHCNVGLLLTDPTMKKSDAGLPPIVETPHPYIILLKL